MRYFVKYIYYIIFPLSGIAQNQNNGVQMALWITGSISMFWMILWIMEVVYRFTNGNCNKTENPFSLQDDEKIDMTNIN